jgi:hypothetical protein
LKESIKRFNECSNLFVIAKQETATDNLIAFFDGLLVLSEYITSITQDYEAPADSIIRRCESAGDSLSKIADHDYNKYKAEIEQLSDPATKDDIRKTLVRLLKTAQRPEDFREAKLPSIMFKKSEGVGRSGILEELFSRLLRELREVGFAWYDFDTDNDEKKPAIGLEKAYRYILSKALSRAIMKHQNIHVVIRAHQHHGPMAVCLTRDRGFVELWDRSIGNTISVKKDAVYTLDVAYTSTMRAGKVYDTITELEIKNPDDIRTWILRKNFVVPVLSRPSIPAIVPTVFVTDAVTAGVGAAAAAGMTVLKSPTAVASVVKPVAKHARDVVTASITMLSSPAAAAASSAGAVSGVKAGGFGAAARPAD